jgi:hypothetical protein
LSILDTLPKSAVREMALMPLTLKIPIIAILNTKEIEKDDY